MSEQQIKEILAIPELEGLGNPIENDNDNGNCNCNNDEKMKMEEICYSDLNLRIQPLYSIQIFWINRSRTNSFSIRPQPQIISKPKVYFFFSLLIYYLFILIYYSYFIFYNFFIAPFYYLFIYLFIYFILLS